MERGRFISTLLRCLAGNKHILVGNGVKIDHMGRVNWVLDFLCTCVFVAKGCSSTSAYFFFVLVCILMLVHLLCSFFCSRKKKNDKRVISNDW